MILLINNNLYIFIKNQYIQNEKIQFKYYLVLVFFEFFSKINIDKINKIKGKSHKNRFFELKYGLNKIYSPYLSVKIFFISFSFKPSLNFSLTNILISLE